MPFTPVHSLITLPFLRIKPAYLSATALVIGSMAPDFEYFLTMDGNNHHGHTWLGSLYLDVPITILTAFAFHLIVKKNLIQNLPLFFQQRLQSLLNFDFWENFKKHYLVFIASAWAGIWSHFFMDSFTHKTGFFVRHLHYGEIYTKVFGTMYPTFFVLQMVVSVLGLVALVVYFVMLKPELSVKLNYTPSLKYWMSALVVAVSILCVHYGVVKISFEPHDLVIPAITAVLGALTICGFFKFEKNTLSTDW